MFIRLLAAMAITCLVAACATSPHQPADLDGPASTAAQETPAVNPSTAFDPNIAQGELSPSSSSTGGSNAQPMAHHDHQNEMHDEMGGMSHGDSSTSQPSTTQAEAVYTCPMHPEIHQDHPGKCPICGMKLIKKEPAQKPQKGGNP